MIGGHTFIFPCCIVPQIQSKHQCVESVYINTSQEKGYTFMNQLHSKPRLWILGTLVLVFAVAAGIIFLNDDTAASDETSESQPPSVDTSGLDSQENDTATVTTTADITLAGLPLNFEDIPVPRVPFPDNPDPNECGIPQEWGNDNAGWLTGMYEGEMHQPIVYLYDSHGRANVVAAAPHGTEIEIVMFQSNPVQNYYYVRIPDAPEGQQLGWVPAAFLSLEPLGT